MRIFKIYAKVAEYVVLKCPYCNYPFRANPQDKVFGKERINAKCMNCEKKFNFKENQMEEDPMVKMWDYKEMIMVKPSGGKNFFSKDKVKVPEMNFAGDKLK